MTADTNLGHPVGRCGGLSDAASEAMRWIPVSERLPEPLVEVLLYRVAYEQRMVGFWNGISWFSDYGLTEGVTHWTSPSREPTRQ